VRTRVVIQRCTDYAFEQVVRSMRTCLEPLGGMSAFVQPGQRVLLKPNLLIGVAPEKATTTHPAVVEAAIILVREAGGEPFVGDSPGVGTMAAALRAAGVQEVLERHDVAVADFTHEVVFECGDNVIARKISLAQALADCDVVISLPKLKTHVQMTFTCAVKNQFGLVVGARKSSWHFRLLERQALANLLIDINRIVAPVLTIVDAVVAMQGEGPSSGEPCPMNLLVAGTDVSAVDTVGCALTGLNPLRVPTIAAARERRWGATALDQIELLGVPLEQAAVTSFIHVASLKSLLNLVPLPPRVLRWLSQLWAPRPRIDTARCIHCGACRKGCPVAPPAIDPERPPPRHVDDKTCIRCYCCHEFCPAKAIFLRRSLPDRLLQFEAVAGWIARHIMPLLRRH